MAGKKQIVVDGELVDVVDDNTDNDDQNGDDQDDDQSDGGSDQSDDDDDQGDDDDDLDKDGKPKEVEAWMADEDDDDQQLSDVPVGTHIRMKQKLKGRLSDKDDELEKLKAENEALKTGMMHSPAETGDLPKRPVENDFDSVQEFELALTKYEDSMLQVRLDAADKRRNIKRQQEAAKAGIETAVDDHYERAAELVDKNKIAVEVYKKADRTVREVVEAVRPGQGDIVTDFLISVVGEGSEKVMYFLGKNNKALGQFKSLLSEDPSGIRASMFLGQQKQRLLHSKQQTSKARPPADNIKGDNNQSPAKGGALLKKRKAAIRKGDVQVAYNIKKQARESGIDVSNW
jgi:hypothetical protein